MEFQIPIAELQKRKLFIGTPMYGGQCAGIYTQSMTNLAATCARYNIEMRIYYLFNESLIQRARNYVADEFMRSDCTHLLFIDSDIGFKPDDVLTLLALQSDDSEYDILAGPYPKKCISWEKIVQAVNKGVADEDPNVLDRYVGDYVFNTPPGVSQIQLNQPVEVMETGTGFMMIKRSTFEKYREAYPEYSYKPDHVRTANFDGSREIHAYFDVAIDPESRRLLSEDYMFCQNVRKMGGKVFILPWLSLAHMGSMVFGGSLVDLATIGASLTADVGKIKTKSK